MCNTIRCHDDDGDDEEDDDGFKSTACLGSIKSGQRCGKTTRTTTWPMGPQDYDDDEFLDKCLDRGGSHS